MDRGGPRSAGDVGRRLLERTDHLRAVGVLLDGLRRGTGGALVLTGDAGVGKTSLAEVAATAASDDGAVVLRAVADHLEAANPWGVAVQLLSRLLRDPDLAGVLDRTTPGVRSLLERGGQAGEPSSDPFPLLHAIHWAILDLAEAGPLVLVVDDAQWSDPQSLRLLCYLLRRVEEQPVALVVAARDGEAEDEAAALLHRLAADPRTALHAVPPLSGEAVRALVHDRVAGASERFCDAVATAVGGNPFLCHEVLAAVEAEGLVPDDAAASRLRDVRPAGVRRSVLLRLAQLGPDAGELARAVAVLGPQATAPVLGRTTGLPPVAVADGLDRLASAGVLADGPPVGFAHPMVRELVLMDLGPFRTRRAHAAAARALHDDGAPAVDVAAHLLRGDEVHQPWAVAALRAAAARHRATAAPSAAAELLDLAARTCGPEERTAVLTELGEAEVAAGDPGAAAHFAAALADAGASDPTLQLRLGDALYADGRWQDAAAVFEAGLDDAAATAADDTVVALLLAGLDNAALMDGRRPDRLPRPGEATGPVPTATGPVEQVVLAAAARRHALAFDLPHRRVRDLAAAALDGPDLPPVLDRQVLEQVALALVVAEDHDRCRTSLDAVLRRAEERGELPAYTSFLPLRALCHLRAGALQEAAGDAEVAMRLGSELEGSSRQALAVAAHVLVTSALARGDLSAAERALDDVDASQRWTASPVHGWYLAALGAVRLRQGDPGAALQAFRAAGTTFGPLGTGAFCGWRSGVATSLHLLDRPAEAAATSEEEVALARRFGAHRTLARALRTAAQLCADEHDRSLALLEEAVALLDGEPAALEDARTTVELGAAMRRAGRMRECRAVLRRGMDVARRCGATAVVRRAADELAASGARRPDLAVSGVAALTPSELRVARLAAQGLGNRQIAESLFVTRKTVELHLSHTYRKLAITGRDELDEALAGGSGGLGCHPDAGGTPAR